METDLSTGDGLDGIPMLGPTRRARLAAAGFATPEALSRASVEEVSRVAQMPQGQAAQVLEYALALAAQAPESPSDAPTPPDPGPTTAADDAPVAAPSAGSDDALAAAIVRMRTSVDAVLEHKEAARIIGPLARFAGTLERLAASAHRVDDETRARLTRRLNRLAERLEGAASKDAPRKRFVRMRERLKAARRQVRKSFVPIVSE
ncbi:MAG TPA: hypothetical protein VM490_07395 [Armatimonadaceae bacterium]|nr:hypothetical protein [Armatimonadaceae bacterium]